MATKKKLDGFKPLFGKAKMEENVNSVPETICDHTSICGCHYLYRMKAINNNDCLEVVVTDFQSSTWSRILSVVDLEDIRDEIGVAGTWSEFVDFVESSLTSGDANLLFSGLGDDIAKLVAAKSKGLPRIAITVHKIKDSTAHDVIANFSLALYMAYNIEHENLLKEQEESLKLAKLLSSEREKTEMLQKRLESLSFLSKRKAPNSKLQHISPSISDAGSLGDQTSASDTQEVSHNKVHKWPEANKRFIPKSQRLARLRGALLQDTDDIDDEN